MPVQIVPSPASVPFGAAQAEAEPPRAATPSSPPLLLLLLLAAAGAAAGGAPHKRRRWGPTSFLFPSSHFGGSASSIVTVADSGRPCPDLPLGCPNPHSGPRSAPWILDESTICFGGDGGGTWLAAWRAAARRGDPLRRSQPSRAWGGWVVLRPRRRWLPPADRAQFRPWRDRVRALVD
jgi:hypothetical protein